MSLVYGPLFHWSPAEYRAKISRRGLRPSTPSSTTISFADLLDSYDERNVGIHYDVEDDVVSFKAVCLGMTPSHAWALSGACDFEPGKCWDLWQVSLDEGDLVFPPAPGGVQARGDPSGEPHPQRPSMARRLSHHRHSAMVYRTGEVMNLPEYWDKLSTEQQNQWLNDYWDDRGGQRVLVLLCVALVCAAAFLSALVMSAPG